MEIVFLIVGLILLTLGALILWDNKRFRKTAVNAQGQVVAYAETESKSKKGKTKYYTPVISYSYQGDDYQFSGMISSNLIKYNIGDMVPVLLDPANPERARLDSSGLKIMGIFFLLFGIVTSVIFFFAFSVNLVSVAIAVVIIAVLSTKAIHALHKAKIHNIDDLKIKIQQLRQSGLPMSNTQDQDRRLITDPSMLRARKAGKPASLVFIVIFLLVGLGALAGGVVVTLQRAAFLENAVPAEGVVTGLKAVTSTSEGRTTTSYYPLVRFTPTGHTAAVDFQHDVGSSPPAFRAGEKVVVLYLPEDPGEAIIDQGWMNWFGSGILFILGTTFSLVAVFLLRQRRKTAKTSPKLDF